MDSGLSEESEEDKNMVSASSPSFTGLLSTFRTVKYEHLVAGISGGVVSTLILHPLDLLKIRFAVDDGSSNRAPYKGVKSAFATIIKTEGMSGLYRGVTPNTVGAGSAWGFYFLFYQTIKTEKQEGNSRTQLTPTDHLVAATEAGILTLALTNPIWVVKTRLCLQYENKLNTKVDTTRHYTGMVDAFRKIIKYEGVKGLYKGFTPGLFGVSHGAVQFMAYEELKCKYNQYRKQPIDTKLSTTEYLLFAAISKFFAAVSTYPYQVIRARLQDANCTYSGATDCIRQTVKKEGISGLYKGMTPYLVHVMPNICLVFLIYEKITNG
ncbi:mitochondrial folate transporter/carrier [Eurytemora carolleeae]|uniref:mitochondrial folate transporter/carrier n=1 Tax=Eurytemora carolleeae TaxID=1294199 RepID=UPI000C7583EF|nr:mitochondrial folate transporter/carrier [Eurytemora carolleeae]XP_023332804.1 mitochondrial folate transporter/carrier [Eurytemora carolleeae]XP_023332805.1 mitochondrial folate transporter/carrier [Eurytemora carolleeae]|eukprot:XP_023332803.1 mitochondrial folate transporter/carrier-like [Eurytemora affinis]